MVLIVPEEYTRVYSVIRIRTDHVSLSKSMHDRIGPSIQIASRLPSSGCKRVKSKSISFSAIGPSLTWSRGENPLQFNHSCSCPRSVSFQIAQVLLHDGPFSPSYYSLSFRNTLPSSIQFLFDHRRLFSLLPWSSMKSVESFNGMSRALPEPLWGNRRAVGVEALARTVCTRISYIKDHGMHWY
jgi:hypothetical protein